MPWRWRPRLRFHLVPVTVHVRPLRHRRVTHYPETVVPAMILLAVLAATIGPVLGVLAAGAAIGITMHLAADACTLTGIPSLTNVLRGQPDRRLHLLPDGHRFRTGSRNEHRARILLTIATAALVAGIVWLQGDNAPDLDWRIIAGIAAFSGCSRPPPLELCCELSASKSRGPPPSSTPVPPTRRAKRHAASRKPPGPAPSASASQRSATASRSASAAQTASRTCRSTRRRSRTTSTSPGTPSANSASTPTRTAPQARTATVVLRDPFHNAARHDQPATPHRDARACGTRCR